MIASTSSVKSVFLPKILFRSIICLTWLRRSVQASRLDCHTTVACLQTGHTNAMEMVQVFSDETISRLAVNLNHSPVRVLISYQVGLCNVCASFASDVWPARRTSHLDIGSVKSLENSRQMLRTCSMACDALDSCRTVGWMQPCRSVVFHLFLVLTSVEYPAQPSAPSCVVRLGLCECVTRVADLMSTLHMTTLCQLCGNRLVGCWARSSSALVPRFGLLCL